LGVEYGWLGVIDPLTISILILKVCRIPLLEKTLSKNLLYLEYMEKQVFFGRCRLGKYKIPKETLG
jgi:hypothetical protein